MKILFLAHNGKRYGANLSLVTLMAHLSQKHNVMLFTPFKNYFSDKLDEHNLSYYSYPYYASPLYARTNNPKYLIYPILFLLDIVTFPFLLLKAAKFKPDIVYSNSSVENIGFFLAKALGVKHITHVREFGDLDYDFNFLLGKKNKTRFLNKSNGVIFNSKAIENGVLPKTIQQVQTRVIYNGLDLGKVDYKPKSIAPGTRIVFGSAGYLQEKKGQLEAVKYLSKHLKANPNIELQIFGGGVSNYISKIERYISDEGLQGQVFLKGFNNQINEIYKDIHVLLVFAKNEAFGRVTIEAMQRGIPVIAYNGGGTAELISNHTDGILFNNEGDFDKGVEKLLNDAQFYQRLSDNSIEKVKANFSQITYCINIENFLSEVV